MLDLDLKPLPAAATDEDLDLRPLPTDEQIAQAAEQREELLGSQFGDLD